jgi:hypothetical protein
VAKPASPSIGTRMLYYAALPSAPTTGAPPPVDIIAQVGPYPATVVQVGGSAPDYLPMLLSVHGPDGNTYLRTAVLNIATWTTNGSKPGVARWDYVDLTA